VTIGYVEAYKQVPVCFELQLRGGHRHEQLPLLTGSCDSGVIFVLHWCYSSVSAVLQWCYSDVTVVLE
jgi:hypothetical protein